MLGSNPPRVSRESRGQADHPPDEDNLRYHEWEYTRRLSVEDLAAATSATSTFARWAIRDFTDGRRAFILSYTKGA